jgi:hypothetical protein
MTAFTIQASKNAQTITTVRIRPAVCVEKAKALLREGWRVYITNAAGHQFGSDAFDQLVAESSLVNGTNGSHKSTSFAVLGSIGPRLQRPPAHIKKHASRRTSFPSEGPERSILMDERAAPPSLAALPSAGSLGA